MAGIRHSGLLSWLHLIRLYNKMQHHSMDHLAQYDLTPAQFDVIAQLKLAPGISQQKLAEKLLVTKGNICGLLDRMEKQDLVERRDDPDDRRSHKLYLTEKADKLAEWVIPAHEQYIQEHMAVLSGDEQRTLLTLLRDLERGLDRHKH